MIFDGCNEARLATLADVVAFVTLLVGDWDCRSVVRIGAGGGFLEGGGGGGEEARE